MQRPIPPRTTITDPYDLRALAELMTAATPNSVSASKPRRRVTLAGYDTHGALLDALRLVGSRRRRQGASVVIDSATLTAGETARGEVRLAKPAGAPVRIELISSSPSVASLPATITIPAGSSRARFQVRTANPAAARERVAIHARAAGRRIAAGAVTIRYNLGL